MYLFRLFDLEGGDAGEAHCPGFVSIGEAIRSTDGRLLRVVNVVPVFEEARYAGLFTVEPA